MKIVKTTSEKNFCQNNTGKIPLADNRSGFPRGGDFDG